MRMVRDAPFHMEFPDLWRDCGMSLVWISGGRIVFELEWEGR